MFHSFWHLWLISVRVANVTPIFIWKTHSFFLAMFITLTLPWINPLTQKLWLHRCPHSNFFFSVYMLPFSPLWIEVLSTFLFSHQNLAHLPQTFLTRSSVWQSGWVFYIFPSKFIWNLDHVLSCHTLCSFSPFWEAASSIVSENRPYLAFKFVLHTGRKEWKGGSWSALLGLLSYAALY